MSLTQRLSWIALSAAAGYVAHSVYNEVAHGEHAASPKPNDRSTVSLADTPPPKHDVSVNNVSEAREEFIQLLGEEHVATDAEVRLKHSSTPWSPALSSQRPALVLHPNATSDVSEILKICSRRRIPVTAFSGGTSFGGALTSTRGGVCINMNRMNKILAIYPDDMDAIVQPAVGWQQFNAVLAKQSLFFPPDPGPGAQIGGMIAMSCSGTNAYRHGTVKAWIISMTVVLADGTVVKTRRRPRKSSAGYDLASLIIGAEGTLGIVTEAVVKVTSAPENLHVAIATFPDTGAAVKTAITMIGAGIQVDALELLDKPTMWSINKAGMSPKQWREKTTLFIKFSGSQQTVDGQIQQAREATEVNACETFEVSADKDETEILWRARKTAAEAWIKMKSNESDIFLTADVAVPISKLGEMIDATLELTEKAGFLGSTMGHLGDGNYHAAIICPKDRKEEAETILDQLRRKGLGLQGTITGEHGIGLKLRDMLVEEVGDEAVDMMRKIKLALDPLCLLNCDKVIRLEEGV